MFFWLFSGERPHFGWKWLYAYASAPDWFLPRNLHLFVAAGLLILISLAGVALLRLVPDLALPAVLFGIATNTAGSMGDIVVIFLLMFQAKNVLVRDIGDAIQIYK